MSIDRHLRNGFLTLDTSYTARIQKYFCNKNKAGSRNHIFAELDFDFAQDLSL